MTQQMLLRITEAAPAMDQVPVTVRAMAAAQKTVQVMDQDQAVDRETARVMVQAPEMVPVPVVVQEMDQAMAAVQVPEMVPVPAAVRPARTIRLQ